MLVSINIGEEKIEQGDLTCTITCHEVRECSTHAFGI